MLLQVCLGARARDTGRSSAAKDLINYNANTAVAKTVLWNTVRPLTLHLTGRSERLNWPIRACVRALRQPAAASTGSL
jgi:hypothetical protein